MDHSYHQDGHNLDYTPSSAVSAGAIVVWGILVCIVINDIAANVLGAVRASGVIKTAKKVTGTAWTKGQRIYYDESEDTFTHVATDNVYAGVAAYAAASASATGYVLLNVGAPPDS